MQNLSIGVNVVSRGSPSRILRVLLISLGITIRPRSSTLLTMPVAFIYLSPFLRRIRPPCVKGAGRNLWFLTGGLFFIDTLQSLRHGLRRATSLCPDKSFAYQCAECRNVFFPGDLDVVDTALDKVDFIAHVVQQHSAAGLRQGMFLHFCFLEQFTN